ncbi:hypothetical protein DJ94_5038 [Bacillus pseudomycoides]|nr:hypothetical protein DJ94_5038 [Bacillus pseudomycoides]
MQQKSIQYGCYVSIIPELYINELMDFDVTKEIINKYTLVRVVVEIDCNTI